MPTIQVFVRCLRCFNSPVPLNVGFCMSFIEAALPLYYMTSITAVVESEVVLVACPLKVVSGPTLVSCVLLAWQGNPTACLATQ